MRIDHVCDWQVSQNAISHRLMLFSQECVIHHVVLNVRSCTFQRTQSHLPYLAELQEAAICLQSHLQPKKKKQKKIINWLAKKNRSTRTRTHKRTQAHAQEHVRMYVLTIETPAINHEIKEEIKKLNLITYNFGRSAIWIAVIISQHVNTPLCVRVRIDGLVSKRRRPTLTGFITSRGI